MATTRLRPGLAERFSLSRFWNKKDLGEVSKNNRKLWEQFKKERNLGLLNTSLKSFPEFFSSIESLHFNQGYSLTDVGAMFGLTPERIRQYFEVHHLKRRDDERGALYRLWSDEENRFVTLVRRDLEFRLREERKKKLEEKREGIRQLHVRTVQKLAEEKGRTPLLSELGQELGYRRGYEASFIGYAWGVREDNDMSYKEAIDKLYLSAGILQRRSASSIPGGKTSRRESNTLGARLTEKRLEISLSQTGVAISIGYAKGTIYRHERNMGHPRKNSLKKYATFYGVTENWLLTGTD